MNLKRKPQYTGPDSYSASRSTNLARNISLILLVSLGLFLGCLSAINAFAEPAGSAEAEKDAHHKASAATAATGADQDHGATHGERADTAHNAPVHGTDSHQAMAGGHGGQHGIYPPVPRPIDSYDDEHLESLGAVLLNRIKAEPFNLLASLLFLCAIIHTFLAGKFMKIAHQLEHEHNEKIERLGLTAEQKPYRDAKDDVSLKATVFHFLGEVEAVFGIWVIPLLICMTFFYDWHAVTNFFDHVHYTEPMFVVVIMTIASTRPVLKFSEKCLHFFASLGKGSATAWWFSILTVAPILGSFITEPAAMTIAALLLAHKFYGLKPRPVFAYGTLGLLFVNVSVGGTLTHFAAPPVLMVASKWGWGLSFMFTHFGWKAVLGIIISNILYYMIFRKEFASLNEKLRVQDEKESKSGEEEPVPFWVTLVVLGFMAWTVVNLHHPALFIGGFLFFLAFTVATATHHEGVGLRNPLLVGFFLAGLVTHGGLQQWWIAPVLSNLSELPLFLGATILTAFNDNAAITFLASQVPSFDPHLAADQAKAVAQEYAVVAGAVTGGGLTVIANAPNPAGQAILGKYFEEGIAPLYLLLGAIVPTIILGVVFMGLA